MAKAKHAKLAPSASERWINCPISVHLSEGFQDTQSVYAAEGTLAHKLCELKLRDQFTDNKPTTREFSKVRKNEMFDTEMEEATDEYVEQIRAVLNQYKEEGLDPELIDLMIETHLDMSQIVGHECFGTADCIIIAPNELHVFDFKYGRNVEVDAVDNTQMRLYATGAYEKLDMIYDIEKISTHIVQPRMNNFSTEELSVTELDLWAETTLKPAAHDAAVAKGNPKCGKWCQFCPAKPVCREYGRPYEDVPDRELPPDISDEEVAQRIAMLDGIDSYLKELREYALKAILQGKEIPGYKAVEGRSNRVWTDQEKAFQVAQEAGYDRTVLYEQQPLSLSKIEKLMGKKKFESVLGEYVNKPKGAPTLVKNSDKRETYKKTTAKEDFKNIDIEFD